MLEFLPIGHQTPLHGAFCTGRDALPNAVAVLRKQTEQKLHKNMLVNALRSSRDWHNLLQVGPSVAGGPQVSGGLATPRGPERSRKSRSLIHSRARKAREADVAEAALGEALDAQLVSEWSRLGGASHRMHLETSCIAVKPLRVVDRLSLMEPHPRT
jgi:hypothetical protein